MNGRRLAWKSLDAPIKMYQKLTIIDPTGKTHIVRDDLSVSSNDPCIAAKLKSDIDSICANYRAKGNPLTSHSIDLAMELIGRGWKLKSLESAHGAGETFLSDAEHLAREGLAAELRVNSRKGTLESLLDIFTMQRCYRMSTLSLAFSCEAYINLYGIERLGKDEFESFERLPPEDKWIVIPRIVTGRTFDKGAGPFQDLAKLVKTRNDWVHHKPPVDIIEFGKPMKTKGKKPAPFPKSYVAVEKQITQVKRLIKELHSFDGSTPMLSKGYRDDLKRKNSRTPN